MSEQKNRKLGLNVPAATADRLRELSERTDIPQSRLLRQALDLLFEKYAEQLRAKRSPKR